MIFVADMKKLTALIVVALTLAVAPGCAILRHTDPTTGEVIIDQQKLEQTAALIQTTVSGGIIIALDKNPNDAAAIKSYLKLAQAAIDELIAGENWDPQALQNSITSIQGVDSPEIKLAITTALGLYRIYLADSVTAPINKDLIALTLLTALRDGLALGTS